MLTVGQTVEDFTVTDHTGADVRWSSLRGAPVVLFFYPKADTPGCTKEACAFRDLYAEFQQLGVHVFGVSADAPAKQAKFATKYGLTMPLWSDPDHVVLTRFGVWAEKTMYGRTSMGIVRSSFLFDKDGVLRVVWPKVKVDGHAEVVRDAARALVG